MANKAAKSMVTASRPRLIFFSHLLEPAHQYGPLATNPLPTLKRMHLSNEVWTFKKTKGTLRPWNRLLPWHLIGYLVTK